MDARLTKAEAALVFPLPSTPGADRIEALRDAAGRANQTALMRGVARVADFFLGWPERARIRAELSSLSDRELADMGLTRGDINRVVNGDFSGHRM